MEPTVLNPLRRCFREQTGGSTGRACLVGPMAQAPFLTLPQTACSPRFIAFALKTAALMAGKRARRRFNPLMETITGQRRLVVSTITMALCIKLLQRAR